LRIVAKGDLKKPELSEPLRRKNLNLDVSHKKAKSDKDLYGGGTCQFGSGEGNDKFASVKWGGKRRFTGRSF